VKKPLKETPVKNAIKNWLKKEGIFYWSAAAGPYSTHGISDILALHRGVLFALEVKAPGKAGNATVHQLRFIDAVRAAGGQGAVVDTLDAVKELFNASHTPRKCDCVKAEESE
jgi:hypothetical protein